MSMYHIFSITLPIIILTKQKKAYEKLLMRPLDNVIGYNSIKKELYNLVNEGYYLYENTKNTYLKLCRSINTPINQLKLPITFSHSILL